MYEYIIVHRHCGNTQVIYGYDYIDACRRWGIDPNLWFVQNAEYVG